MTIPIEFLYFDDCPSHEKALARLKKVLGEEGLDYQLTITRIETQQEAEAAQFIGSPTIRTADSDLFPVPDMPYGLACRGFQRPDGRITPVPTEDMIRIALHNQLKNSRSHKE